MPETFLWYLVSLMLRSMAIAVVAGLCTYGIRSIAIRHAVWTAVLGGMIAMPLLDMVLPAGIVTVPIPEIGAEFLLQSSSGTSPADSSPQIPPGIASSSMMPSWPSVAVGVYILITMLLGARFALSCRNVRRLARSSRSVSDSGIRDVAEAYGCRSEIPAVHESSGIGIPVTIGITRPLILLPAGWKTWTLPTRHAVLAHELSHVRRRDPAIMVIAAAATCVFWYNPLSWWLRRELSQLCESACDQESILLVRDSAQYAETLLSFARVRESGPILVGGASMARHQMRLRIDRILAMRKPRTGILQRETWIAVIAATLPVLLIAAGLQESSENLEAATAAPQAVSAILTPPQQSPQATPVIVEEVQVRGNRRIRTETILYNIRTKAGLPLDPTTVSEDVKRLAALGMFSEIQVEDQPAANGRAVVIINVQEAPLLRRVVYNGLSSLTMQDVLAGFRANRVGLTEESVYTPEKAAAAAAVLKSMLAERGHDAAIVTITVEPLPPNAVRLIFDIQEGPRR